MTNFINDQETNLLVNIPTCFFFGGRFVYRTLLIIIINCMTKDQKTYVCVFVYVLIHLHVYVYIVF